LLAMGKPGRVYASRQRGAYVTVTEGTRRVQPGSEGKRRGEGSAGPRWEAQGGFRRVQRGRAVIQGSVTETVVIYYIGQ
jgi:hypothetical protein